MTDENPAPTSGDGPAAISGYPYCVVVATGAVSYSEAATPAELADKLREEYQRAVTSGRPDVRVFVIAGRRLPVVGHAGRAVTLADGTVLQFVEPPPQHDDYLMSVADRAAAGGAPAH